MMRTEGEKALAGVDEGLARSRLGDTGRQRWEGIATSWLKAAAVEKEPTALGS
jgi:hypothetical protein